MFLNELYFDSNEEIDIVAIHDDSRLVEPGSLFVALDGHAQEGIQFIDEAVERGAVVIAYDRQKGIEKKHNVCYLPVSSSKKFLRDVTKRFYGDPSKIMPVIGVTGTNGKTTVTYLVENLMSCYQKQYGMIGTIHHRIGDQVLPSINTTPGFLANQKMLQMMVDNQCQGCVMEVSSHALDQGRVDGIDFAGAVFTNLSQDHLDYHGTMQAYYDAKAKLFRQLSNTSWAVINVDDEFGLQLSADTPARVITYGIDNKADLMCEVLESSLEGMHLLFSCDLGQMELKTPLIGKYNAYNLLAAAAVGIGMGFSLDDIHMGLEVVTHIPGRMERLLLDQSYFVFIDYAHTPDGIENVLSALQPLKKNRIISVFGCGGDRDRGKRPQMGLVATTYADHVIITTDNPRSEEPQQIINDIVKGIKKENYEVVLDRRCALAKALDLAMPQDIILVLGKGHETYQILHDQTIEFDEKKIIHEILNQ